MWPSQDLWALLDEVGYEWLVMFGSCADEYWSQFAVSGQWDDPASLPPDLIPAS